MKNSSYSLPISDFDVFYGKREIVKFTFNAMDLALKRAP